MQPTLRGAPARLQRFGSKTLAQSQRETGSTTRVLHLLMWERQLNRQSLGVICSTKAGRRQAQPLGPLQEHQLNHGSLRVIHSTEASMGDRFNRKSTSSTASCLGVIHSTEASGRRAQPLKSGYPRGNNRSNAEGWEQCSQPEQTGVRLTARENAAYPNRSTSSTAKA